MNDYPGATDPLNNRDSETGEALPHVKIKVLDAPATIKGYAELSKTPVEQCQMWVKSLYPEYHWIWDDSPVINWFAAVALDQHCGVGDVVAVVNEQLKFRHSGQNMRKWLMALGWKGDLSSL